MVAPLPPTLLKPQTYEYTGATYTLEWRYNHPQRVPQSHIRIRRREVPSGSYVWLSALSGGSWDTQADIAHTGQQATVVSNMGSAGDRYQYSISTRSSSGDWSGYSEERLVYVVGDPTVVVETISTDSTSPDIFFVYSHPQGISMSSYRVALIDTGEVAEAFGSSDANDTDLQKRYAFIGPWDEYIDRTDWISDSEAYMHNMQIDLVPGRTYDFVVETQSDGGQVAIDVERVTVSADVPPPPNLIVTADNENNVMHIELLSPFNMITSNSSADFETAVPNDPGSGWIHDPNISTFASTPYAGTPVVPVQGDFGGRYQVRGVQYGELADEIDGTYADAAIAYPMYENAQTKPTTIDDDAHTLILDDMIPIDSGTDYTLGVLWNGPDAPTLKLLCYDVSSSLVGTITGDPVGTDPLGITGWESSRAEFTSYPGGTTKVRPLIEFDISSFTSIVGARYWVDMIGLARSDSDIWSTGGYTSEMQCIIERVTEVNGRTVITPVLGYSRSAPGQMTNPLSGSLIERDRMVPIGYNGDITYRAYVIGYNDQGEQLASAPAIRTLTNPIRGNGWWLRDLFNPAFDVQLKQLDFLNKFGPDNEVLMPVGRDDAVVITNDLPFSDQFTLHMLTETQDEYNKVDRLLRSGETFYVQSNVAGNGWYVRVIGRISNSIVKSPSSVTNVQWRPLYEWNAEVTQVGVPLLQARTNYNYVPGISYVVVD